MTSIPTCCQSRASPHPSRNARLASYQSAATRRDKSLSTLSRQHFRMALTFYTFSHEPFTSLCGLPTLCSGIYGGDLFPPVMLPTTRVAKHGDLVVEKT